MKNLKKDYSSRGGVSSVLSRRLGKASSKQVITMSGDDSVLIPMLSGKYTQDTFRRGDYLHVSDLLYKCIRKIGISEKIGEDIHAETIWPGRALTFKYGHATQEYLTDLLKSNSPKELFGDWICPCETLFVKDKVWKEARNKKCPKCGNAPYRYVEKIVRDNDYMVTGAIDLLLLIEGYLYVNECKSMAAKSWKEIKRPKPEHTLQALFYWWLLKKQGVKLWDKVSIIYVNKEYMWSGLPFKEFWFQPSVIEDRLDDLKHEAMSLVNFRKQGQLPPRITCESPSSPDAKRCQFKHVCFEMEN